MVASMNWFLLVVWTFLSAFSPVTVGLKVRLSRAYTVLTVIVGALVSETKWRATYYRASLVRYKFLRAQNGAVSYEWILAGLVFVLIAVNIVPIIVTSVTDATGVGGPLEGTSVAPLFDFLPLLITIGVVVGVVALSMRNRGN